MRRITVRRLMLAIAAMAVLLCLAREFSEGLPPLSVLRLVPGRIGRLKPGITGVEVNEILGLEKTWYRGGVRPKHRKIVVEPSGTSIFYSIRDPFPVPPASKAIPPPPLPSAVIHLRFEKVYGDGSGRPPRRFFSASYSEGGRTIAEMRREPLQTTFELLPLKAWDDARPVPQRRLRDEDAP